MLTKPDRARAVGSLLLSGLPEDVRDALLAEARVIAPDRGAVLFLQGEAPRSAFVVLDGWVKLFRIAPGGTEVVVNCFTTGQSFAEPVVLQDAPYPVSAEAVTDCRLLAIRGGALRELMTRRPEVVPAVMAAMFRHLHGLVGQIEALKAQSGAQRVAHFLLDLCACEAGACEVTLPHDKTLIAGRLGMKPESLSRAFGRLGRKGVAIRQNHALIDDVARLRAYAEEDPADAWTRAK
jgi:CRP-like cAMP-binding protein